LRLTGLANGTALRPVPGAAQVSVEVSAQGAGDGLLWWMLDGQAQGQSPAGQPYVLSFTRNGSHALTVMDAQGRHDRVMFTVSGITRPRF
jgi:penicillin-binding protein 1C